MLGFLCKASQPKKEFLRSKDRRQRKMERKKMQKSTRNTRFGFTLVELLIVIAIIGVLTGISVFALVGTRESARDTKRKTDLEGIKSALEIYKADCNRYPPSSGSGSFSFGGTLVGDGTHCPLTNVYLQSVPQDPLPGRTYSYVAVGNPARSYILCASLETINVVDPRCTASCGGTCSYSAISP